MTEPEPIRVLIISRSPALRAGLRALLDDAEIRVIDEGTELRARLVGQAHIDVVVATGIDLLDGDESEASPALVVLDDAPDAAQRLLRGGGGRALLPREATREEIRAGVLAAAQGFVMLPAMVAARLASGRGLATPAYEEGESLTPREREVLDLVARGLPNKQIARELAISEHTVKFHISSMFAKLGAASRTEAIRIGARRGLVLL